MEHIQHKEIEENTSGSIPILQGPLTQEEKLAEEDRKRRDAKEKSDYSFQERQVQAVEASNGLARRNYRLSWLVAILSGAACGANWYQGHLTSKALEVSNATLQQMKSDSQGSSDQFQTQLKHFDDGLGRTGLLAANASRQAEAAKESALVAQRTLDAATENFHIEQRPWLSLRVVEVLHEPIHWEEARHWATPLTFRVQVLNLGKTPATDIAFGKVEPDVIYPVGTQASDTAMRDAACAGAIGSPKSEGTIIYPGQTQTFEIGAELLASQINRNIGHSAITVSMGLCMRYRPVYKTKEPYVFGQAFEIGVNGTYPITRIPLGRDIMKNELGVTQSLSAHPKIE